MGFTRIRPMQGGDKTRPNSSKAQGPALSQKKGICVAELSTCPILVKAHGPRALQSVKTCAHNSIDNCLMGEGG